MKVLLTGGTGFVGSHLAELLAAEGHGVRALVRTTSNTAHLEGLGAELARGSLSSGEGLDDAVRGVDAIVHLAGGGKVRRTADFYTGNVDTTVQLLEAVERVRPELRRFVHVSSLSAHGPAAGGVPRDPDEPPTPVTHYGKSKAAAEAAVLERAEALPVTIIRPPAVYGPRDTRMLTLYKAVARRGIMPLIGRGHTTSVIYVDDCVTAIRQALVTDHPSGSRYFVEDGHVYGHEDLGRLIGEAVGRTPRQLRLPLFAFATVATLTELYSKLTRRAVALTRDKIRDVRQKSWVCSSASTRADLGWAPTIAFGEGARRTAQWYRAQGWI